MFAVHKREITTMTKRRIVPGDTLEFEGERTAVEQPGVQISKVRMKAALFEKVRQSARARDVTFNAELVYLVEKAFETRDMLRTALELSYGPEIAEKLIEIGNATRDGIAATRLAERGHVS